MNYQIYHQDNINKVINMKLKCRIKLLPSVDVSSQVAWNILSKNIINRTLYYALFILNFISWILLALRFSVLENEFKMI